MIFVGDNEDTEEVWVDEFDETEVIPESLVRVARKQQGRAATSAEWPPPPPRPAPRSRRARFYSVARRPTTSGI